MRKLGKKRLTLQLEPPLAADPAALAAISGLTLGADGAELTYVYDPRQRAGRRRRRCSRRCAARRHAAARTCETTQSSLEDIFVNLVRE